jgi:hypothetical protein
LVEDTVGKLSFWRIVAAVVEGTDLTTVLLELLAEQVGVGGLASEAIAVLSEYYRYASPCHEVTHPFQPRTLKGCAAETGVRHLLHDFVALAPGVRAQRIELLR